MRTSVASAFTSFQSTFEGVVNCMYLDIRGLPTTAIGCLIDPLSEALKLPWLWRNSGRVATQNEITFEWNRVKSMQNLRFNHASVWPTVTMLILSPSSIDVLVKQRAAVFETILRKTFTQYDSWPADAQLGVLSMSWAMGAGFTSKFPSFSSACKLNAFDSTARYCAMDVTGNPGLIPRNAANVKLFTNAGVVVNHKMDREKLWYPQALTADGEILS